MHVANEQQHHALASQLTGKLPLACTDFNKISFHAKIGSLHIKSRKVKTNSCGYVWYSQTCFMKSDNDSS